MSQNNKVYTTCGLCTVFNSYWFFSLPCQTCMSHFLRKKGKIRDGKWLWCCSLGAGGLSWEVWGGLLSVFIWHYYSLGYKFWHVKISDNNDIKFNQWRLLSTPHISAQELGLVIVPKSKRRAFCIIGQQQWPRGWVASGGLTALWS